jgi:transcriptional regulator with XRE-family HTH domain
VRLQLSQERAAEAAGLLVRSYQLLEARNSSRGFNPTIKTLRAVARGLGLDVGDLTREASTDEVARLAVNQPNSRVPQKQRSARKV